MVKIAFLLTGQYRTFPKTWKIIREHLLEPNEATVFVYGESSLPLEATKDLQEKWGPFLGDCKIQMVTKDDEYNRLVDYLKATKPALQLEFLKQSGINVNYVFQSGSIIEYYQYMKAFDQMLSYERKHDVKFTHVVRSRLDVVFTIPLFLHEFFSSDSSIMEQDDYASLNSKLIKARRQDNITDVKSTPSLKLCHEQETLWLFRKNVVWIGSRSVMEKLYPLVYFYGTYLTPSVYSFNSETQFNEYCVAHNITSIDFLTQVEEEYLTTRAKNLTLLDGLNLSETYDRRLVMTIVREPTFYFDH